MRKFYLIIALALSLFCRTSYAWNAMGHRIIAEIAYANLNATAKQRANEYIDYLANAYPYNSSFQTASSWADAIKQNNVHAFDHWHFDDIPFSLDNTPTQPENRENLRWAIHQAETVLNSSQSNQFEKAFFLRFLLHLVGDAHQPLHCINTFSKQFPEGDQGGNLWLIAGPYQNLHAAWDAGLGYFSAHCTFEPTRALQATCLANRIMQDYPVTYFHQQISDIQPADWIDESNHIAKNFAYQIPFNYPLSQTYLTQGQQIVEQRLALAGYRLANVLNHLLG